MSADACKFCKGSGWYEPKNMGGMMVEPCSRCDAHKTIQAAQKTSADVCPVCGCADPHGYFADRLGCGALVDGSECHNAPDLAISRAAEIERLKADKEELCAAINSIVAHIVAMDNPCDGGASADDDEVLGALYLVGKHRQSTNQLAELIKKTNQENRT